MFWDTVPLVELFICVELINDAFVVVFVVVFELVPFVELFVLGGGMNVQRPSGEEFRVGFKRLN